MTETLLILYTKLFIETKTMRELQKRHEYPHELVASEATVDKLLAQIQMERDKG